MTFPAGSGVIGWGDYQPPLDPLPPPPPPPTGPVDDCGITDPFTRTVFGGWGTSDAGAVWGLTPYGWGAEGSQTVNGSRGVLDTASGGYAMVAFTASIWPPPLDLTINGLYLAAANMGVGGPSFQLFFTEYGTPLQVTVTANGVVYLDGATYDSALLGYAVDATNPISVRLVVNAVYTVADLYVWKTAETLPSTPTLSVVPRSGPFYGHPWNGLEQAILFLNSGENSNATASIDSLDIAGMNRCTPDCGITDTFTRTVTNGWGTSDSGHNWSVVRGTGDVQAVIGVSDGKGRVDIAFAALDQDDDQPNIILDYLGGLTPGSSNFDLSFLLTINAMDFSTTDTTPWFSFSYGEVSFSYEAGTSIGNAKRLQILVRKATTGFWIGNTQPFDWSVGTEYRVRVANTFGAWAGVKIWPSAGVQPSGWSVVVAMTDQMAASAGSEPNLYVTNGHSGLSTITTPISLVFDDLDITGVNRCGP